MTGEEADCEALGWTSLLFESMGDETGGGAALLAGGALELVGVVDPLPEIPDVSSSSHSSSSSVAPADGADVGAADEVDDAPEVGSATADEDVTTVPPSSTSCSSSQSSSSPESASALPVGCDADADTDATTDTEAEAEAPASSAVAMSSRATSVLARGYASAVREKTRTERVAMGMENRMVSCGSSVQLYTVSCYQPVMIVSWKGVWWDKPESLKEVEVERVSMGVSVDLRST